ncbi:hypothetical protein GCM10028806_35610 [Spirosoma terrae]|uniref:Fibronectin type-III domain-containing protein n=1 Tax=Spirosoma terrae TaxID=1968276 RepID=A0A6L9LG36_9BACT|nr:hypothetical protein [Spirosoma terrae]NDU97488.1 hypothetical protein [Spirosoma terrae]
MSKLFTIAFLLVLFVSACSKNDDPQLNQPPAAFSVSVKQATGADDVVLSWTKAKDPDGDPVTYAVVWKDTLAKNLTDTTYTLKNVGYTATLSGTIVATDSKKATTTSVFSFTTGEYPYTPVPDVNFEKALIKLGIDDIQDGKVLTASAQKVVKLDLEFMSISSLQGIEAFSNLTELICIANGLTSLDVSKNKALTSLYCGSNPITSLDLSQNVSLLILQCSFNRLTSLDVSKNTALTHLIYNTDAVMPQEYYLKSLDVSKNLALISLACYGHGLTTLDVSRNTALTNLDCSNNNLSSLDVSRNRALTSLNCMYNRLTSLDLRNNNQLKAVSCNNNRIQTICVSDLSVVTKDWVKDNSATYQVCP